MLPTYGREVDMNTTTCPLCGKCYEESSNEEANAPNRRCSTCWQFVHNYVSNISIQTRVREFYEYQRELHNIETSARLTAEHAMKLCVTPEEANEVLREVGIPGYGRLFPTLKKL